MTLEERREKLAAKARRDAFLAGAGLITWLSAAALSALAWTVVLPTIGLLWVVGWL